jgi:hypothetical protein
MRKGTIQLPDGTQTTVEERYRQKVPYYKAPPPWGKDVWFVVPTDKRDSIIWEA